MTKPGVTLQPSKRVVTEAAAQIFAAYIAAGRVEDDTTQHWMKRSILEAVTIARAVDTAVYSDSELPADSTGMFREPTAMAET